MEAGFFSSALLNGVGVVGVVLLVGGLIMRGHLIPGSWHREAMAQANDLVVKAEARADRWEAVALRALDATERLTVPVTVTAKVLSKMPNLSLEEGDEL